MSIVIRNFRRWWQIPRNIRDRPKHRQVTFLELFYDLVYVVLVAELTQALAVSVTSEHLVQFGLIFLIVWFAWLNGTLYHELHGNDDIRTRVFTFLQMFTVAAMSVFAHDAFGETSTGFAVSFAFFQLIFTYMWWRTGVYDPNHRPLSRSYTIAYLVNSLLFFASVFIPAPGRFYVWAGAVLFAFLLPFWVFSRGGKDAEIRAQIEISRTSSASLIERFGLFTIIVLGEVIVGVVQGVAGQRDLTLRIGLIGGLGMLGAIGLWWLYFDFISHRRPSENSLMLWMYAHIPVTAGIATSGAAILNVVEHAGDTLPAEVRWLLVGALTVSLVGLAALIQTLHDSVRDPRAHRTGQHVMLLAAAAMVLLGFSNLQTVPLLVLLTLLLLAPVFMGFLSWIYSQEQPAN